VLLLGGPNSFIRGMREAWQANIPRMWQERKVTIPDGAKPDELIKVPQNAQYFAALGAIEFGKSEDDCVGCYQGYEKLVHYIEFGRQEEKAKSGAKGLTTSDAELDEFKVSYKKNKFTPATFHTNQTVGGFIGIDGGSTSTKAVLLNEQGDILCKAYQLSNGNPIQDTIEMFENLRGQVEAQKAKLEVLGVATTGYAKDILKDVLHADVALVETVAHTESALKFYDDPHVIVDVGGQDIKIIILHNGRVKDFKLNTQCSAGNGYFLQSTAEGFGLSVEQYADLAFSAQSMPIFGYGCAVFMQSDIVNFQRQGWRAEEILAGLATVLPKNVFLYVASIPNLAALGTRFVLQGGTQNNMAVVKAEVDFINNSFRASGKKPEIIVHEFCGESGAIGAAVESLRLWRNGTRTSFVGLEAVRKIEYRTTRNESTRCNFCKNNCLRTFIDIRTVPKDDLAFVPIQKVTKVPLMHGEQRLIIATCEKGLVEDVNDMKDIKAGIDEIKDKYPNFVDFAAHEVFRPVNAKSVADDVPVSTFWKKVDKERVSLMEGRKKIRVGIPRVLNIYTYAPLFNGYLESLGVQPENIVYSDYTNSDLYRAGASRGAIDPCFPAKIGISHVYNLIQEKHRKKPLNVIFFPMYDVLTTPLLKVVGTNACPTVTATPETVKAAFTKENDVFAEHNVKYLDPVLNFADRRLFAHQMLQAWQPLLGLSQEENDRAVEVGYKALEDYETSIRKRARQVLDQLEREDRIGIVMLGRPYHHDPGLNHEIMEEFQKLGYPIFSQNTLPLDEDMLDRLFGEEVRAGVITHPLDITDAWKNSYSCSTNHKVWAAKFTARHPNLVALEISSFKCGHDAPIYGVVEGIIEQSGTPYFCFKDLDENKPSGSIRIRVETIDYFLRRYREEVIRKRKAVEDIEAQLAALEAELRGQSLSPDAASEEVPIERVVQDMAAD
jgi:predicted CoA-substrate-specific enzyme activase